MKRTMFITMLAAALVGGQVFADYIPTITNADKVNDGFYVGEYSQTEDVSGANVTINEVQEGGEDFSRIGVYGGYTIGEQAAASNNKITMTGGQVQSLFGALGKTTVSGNTVIMTGGKVTSLNGGFSTENEALVEKNVVIVAGDSVVGYLIGGGLNTVSGAAKDNKIYLVGKGATATIADAQGNTDTYTGGAISLNTVFGGRGPVSAGNSIDIYGTGITASGLVKDMQILNFHIANLDDGATPMITLPSRLDLTNFLVPTEENPSPRLALTFDALDSMEWKPGASVTLVNAGSGIGIDESLLGKEYNIYRNGDPDKTVLGTATLKLEQGEGTTKILKLVTNGNVPEPTTGILSLLALAALTARRRK